MKILQLIQKKQNRGAEIFASQLSNHLIQNGHDSKLVALFKGYFNLPFNGEITDLNLNFSKGFFSFNSFKKINELILNFLPVIVQANAADTLKFSVFSKLLFRWKQPIVYRNASIMSQYIKNIFSKWFNYFLLSRVDHVISVSIASKSDLIKTFGLPSSKITVIPVGIELVPYYKLPEYDDSHFNMIMVAGFSFEKNHKQMISFFQIVKNRIPSAKLWLVGDGPLFKEINDLIQSSQLFDSIILVGNVSNPMDHIHSADVLLVPSILEGLPAVILEAFYCTTPVVAFNVGGIPEIVTIDTGWLVDQGNKTAFVNAIMDVYTVDDIVLKKKLNAAHDLVVNNYTNEVISKRFEQVYLSVLSQQ